MIGGPKALLSCIILGFLSGLTLRCLREERPAPPAVELARRRPEGPPPKVDLEPLAPLIAERDRLGAAVREAKARLESRRRQASAGAALPAAPAEPSAEKRGLAARWSGLAARIKSAGSEVSRAEQDAAQKEFMGLIAVCLEKRSEAIAHAVARLKDPASEPGELEIVSGLTNMLMPSREEAVVLGRAMVERLRDCQSEDEARLLSLGLPCDLAEPISEIVTELFEAARSGASIHGRSNALELLGKLQPLETRRRVLDFLAASAMPAELKARALTRLDITGIPEAEARLLSLVGDSGLRGLAFFRLASLPASAAVRHEAERAIDNPQPDEVLDGLRQALIVHGDAQTRSLLERVRQDPGYTEEQRQAAAAALSALSERSR